MSFDSGDLCAGFDDGTVPPRVISKTADKISVEDDTNKTTFCRPEKRAWDNRSFAYLWDVKIEFSKQFSFYNEEWLRNFNEMCKSIERLPNTCKLRLKIYDRSDYRMLRNFSEVMGASNNKTTIKVILCSADKERTPVLYYKYVCNRVNDVWLDPLVRDPILLGVNVEFEIEDADLLPCSELV